MLLPLLKKKQTNEADTSLAVWRNKICCSYCKLLLCFLCDMLQLMQFGARERVCVCGVCKCNKERQTT